MISSKPGPSNEELERRVLALEEERASEQSPARMGPRFGPTGDLYTTLQSNLNTGRSLMMGWKQDKVVQHLGWPDLLQTQRWSYEPRVKGAQYLQLIWGEGDLVNGVLWSDSAPVPE